MPTTPESATFEYSDEPPVLVFADGAFARSSAEAAARAAGGRVIAALPIGAAVARLRDHATFATVVVEVEQDSGEVIDELLDCLDQAARRGTHGSIVIVPPHLIDMAAARLSTGDVTMLCDPDDFQRAAAIGAALARSEHRLADVNSDGSGLRLKELSDEVARIAKTLATLAADDAVRPQHGAGAAAEQGGPQVDAALIRGLIRARRMRGQFFPADLFADPAWDMLLDLAAARLEGRAVAVSSLCIASAVPPTTALRWIKTLTDGKLFARVADSNDGRRVFIELTEMAASGIMAYLMALQRIMTLRT